MWMSTRSSTEYFYRRTAEGAASWVAMQNLCRPLCGEQSWMKLIPCSQSITIRLPLRAVYLSFVTDGRHEHLANKAAYNATADCYFEKNCWLNSRSCVCFWRDSPKWARTSSFTKFLYHTQRRTTVGRTPLDEWSARRRDLYLTTHNTNNRRSSKTPVGFEPTISTAETQIALVIK